MTNDALHLSSLKKSFLKVPKVFLIILAIIVVLLLSLVIASFFIDEPLRRYTEAEANRQLKGYTVRIRALDFNPLSLSITLKNMTVTQQKHPDPPVGTFNRIHAGVHWRSILSGMFVGDMEIDHPILHVNLAQLREEQKQPEAVRKKKWQDTIQALHPLKVNELVIRDADVTYVDQDLKRPLHVTQLNVRVSNIHNRPSEKKQFPSPFHIDASIFKTGRAEIDGRANFLADPAPVGETAVSFEGVDLSYLKPILARSNVNLDGGILSVRGQAKSTQEEKVAHVAELKIHKLRVDYVQAESAATKTKKEPAAEKAKGLQKPGVLLRIDRLALTDSEMGLINKGADPDYRIFIANTDVALTNLSNKFMQGPAKLNLSGKFMGSGTTKATATFRPEKNGPDFDMNLAIAGTELTSMNDLLRAYGNFDVVAGEFSFYSELQLKNNHVEGYVKPLFKDLNVYDRRQDKEKSLFRKMYEGLVGGVAGLFENEPQAMATRTDISGPVENPQVGTWQAVINLFRNAFIKAILPGFEEEVRRTGKK